MTKIVIRVCSHLAFLETGYYTCKQTECMCFADSSMIMHMVQESAEVSSRGLRNISHTAYNVYSGARVTDVPYIILYTYIYRLRTFNSSMWGSLRLAPIILYNSPGYDSLYVNHTQDV